LLFSFVGGGGQSRNEEVAELNMSATSVLSLLNHLIPFPCHKASSTGIARGCRGCTCTLRAEKIFSRAADFND